MTLVSTTPTTTSNPHQGAPMNEDTKQDPKQLEIAQLSAISQKALDQAVKLLVAIKVPFAIQLPNGELLGTLTVMTPKSAIVRKRLYDWRKLFPGYGEAIAKMAPGDQLKWTVETEELVEPFRSAVTGTASAHLPKGCYMTAVDHETRTIEILRVE